MSGQNIGTQQPDAGQILNGRKAMFVAALLNFERSFGYVDEKGRVVVAGKRRGLLKKRFGCGVNGVRRNSGRDQRVTLPMLQKGRRVGESVCRGLAVGGRKADDRLAQDAAHAGSFRRLGHVILKVVHISNGGGSAAQHFEQAEARRPGDEIFGDEAALSREDVPCSASRRARDRLRGHERGSCSCAYEH